MLRLVRYFVEREARTREVPGCQYKIAALCATGSPHQETGGRHHVHGEQEDLQRVSLPLSMQKNYPNFIWMFDGFGDIQLYPSFIRNSQKTKNCQRSTTNLYTIKDTLGVTFLMD